MTSGTGREGRFAPLVAIFAGVLPAVTGMLLYKLFTLLASQLGPARTLGIALLFSLAGLGVAVLLAALVAGVGGLRGPRAAWLARLALYGAALANVAAVGLSVFFQNPRYAPDNWRLSAVAAVVVLFLAFVRYGEREQRLLTGWLIRGGQVCLALPLLGLPLVLWAWTTDRPEMPGAPSVEPGTTARADRPKRILLVTFDALRARSALGPQAAAISPTWAALTRETTWYTQLRAASDNTTTSMPTVLSGIGPPRYMRGVQTEGAMIRQGYLHSLGGYLRPAGYASYFATMGVNPVILGFGGEFAEGFSTAPLFDPNMFNTHGFLPWRESFGWLGAKLMGRLNDFEFRGVPPFVNVRSTFDAGRSLLARHPDQSFLWMHVGAPHTPYFDIPMSYDGKTLPAGTPRFVVDVQAEHGTREQLQDYERIYEHYAHFADAELARFVQGLKADHLWDDSLVILTADHGEDFSEPGQPPHAAGLLPETVTHVPLLIHVPGQRAAARDERLYGHEDLAPTVLAAVYGAAAPTLPGRPLGFPNPPSRVVYSWGLHNRHFGRLDHPASLAAYRWPYRYLWRQDPGLPAKETLADLSADPEGRGDVSAAHKKTLAELRTQAHHDVDFYP